MVSDASPQRGEVGRGAQRGQCAPLVFSPSWASPLLPPPAGGRSKTVVTWLWCFFCASKSSIPDNVYYKTCVRHK